MAESVPVAASGGAAKATVATVSRMSFASVAAMPPKDSGDRGVHKTADKGSKHAVQAGSAMSSSSPHSPLEQGLSKSFADLDIQASSVGPGDSGEQETPDVLQYVPKLDDEKTHLSVSSTKAPSLDGKSVASGTTFALDEKESIRPDDSASVQAAEDDDTNSGPGSGAQNSRLGSESGGKPFHAQLREISIQRGIPLPPKLQAGGVEERRNGGLPGPLPMNAVPPSMASQAIPMAPPFSYWMPDEKLLEALDSAKDRLFLLQLEQQLISFIQNPSENSLDLPPQNSFLRLLAHRLGDYYRLSHFVDSSSNAVRLYKTAATQLPTPLSAFRPGASSDDAPQVQPAMTIMRRNGTAPGSEGHATDSGVNTNSNSIVPSKAGSEAGDEGQKVSRLASPADSSGAKDKATQTREEREAKYKEARDRIFAGWKEGESVDKDQSNGPSADASRASSVSGRKKKKKNDDDGFEARSAFYRQQPQGYDQGPNQMGYYNPYVMQNGAPMFQQGYSPQYQAMPQPQMYPGQVSPQAPMASGAAMFQPAAGQQQYVNYGMQPQQMHGQFYPQMQQPQSQMPFQQSFVPSPAYPSFSPQMSRPGSQMSEQGWNHGASQSPFPVYPGSQSPYHPQPPQGMQPSPSNSMSVPYAYGQLPYQPHSPGNRNAHPVPGSYNRQSFNAQARVQSSAQPPQPQANPAQPPYSFPQAVQPMPHNQFMSAFGTSASSSRKSSNQNSQSHSPATSTISKWGTPATLPPKPPPPATAHVHGNSMPTYQNGTYTKPGNVAQDAKAH